MFKRESFGSPFFIFSTMILGHPQREPLQFIGKESRAAAPLRVRKVRAPENRIPVEKPDIGKPMMESAAENSPHCHGGVSLKMFSNNEQSWLVTVGSGKPFPVQDQVWRVHL